MSGASTGAMFGPWGAAIGGVGGGLLGGLKGGDNANPDPAVEDFYGAATPSTFNPMGGQQWSQGPDGKWTSSLGFTGQAADTFGALQGGMNAAANYDPTKARDAAITSNYDQAMSRLNPRLMQQQGQFNAGAVNSGLEPGTEAYNNANLQLQQGQNDALSTAMANAIRQGNETQDTQMRQMNQPFLQAQGMLGMLGDQGNNLNAPLVAAGMKQKANDNAADRASANSAGKKGGAGSMLGGSGGKKGGGDKPAPNNDYNGTWV